MTLLRDIQQSAIDSNVSISTILRKCKVLSARLGSSDFKKWVEFELNGYKKASDVPDYRILEVQSKGSFISNYKKADNVPISLLSLPEDLHENLGYAYCTQPISAYEALIKNSKGGNLREDWNHDIIAAFGHGIYQGMTCLAAWKIIPNSSLVALVDTVRNMVLNFVLEIEAEDPDAGEAEINSPKIPTEKVAQVFNTTIHGNVGNFAEGNATVYQTSTLNVNTNDIDSLSEELKKIGLQSEELKLLINAIKSDNSKNVIKNKKFGPKVTAWLGSLVEKSAQGMKPIFDGVMVNLITKAIFMYYGVG